MKAELSKFGASSEGFNWRTRTAGFKAYLGTLPEQYKNFTKFKQLVEMDDGDNVFILGTLSADKAVEYAEAQIDKMHSREVALREIAKARKRIIEPDDSLGEYYHYSLIIFGFAKRLYNIDNEFSIINACGSDFGHCSSVDGGVLFLFLGITPDKSQIYIAIGHFPVEGNFAMEVVVEQLKKHFPAFDRIVFVHHSDQGQAIVNRIKETYPNWLQHFCNEHLARSGCSQPGGLKNGALIRKLGRCEKKNTYWKLLRQQKKRFQKFVMDNMPPVENWVTAFSPIELHGITSSNFVESGMSIGSRDSRSDEMRSTRDLPPPVMLKQYYNYGKKRFQETVMQLKTRFNAGHLVGPRQSIKYKKLATASKNYKVNLKRGTEDTFYVQFAGPKAKQRVVDTTLGTCTACEKLCVHLFAALLHRGYSEQWIISKFANKKYFLRNHVKIFEEAWRNKPQVVEPVAEDPRVIYPPCTIRRAAGKPKKSRYGSVGEAHGKSKRVPRGLTAAGQRSKVSADDESSKEEEEDESSGEEEEDGGDIGSDMEDESSEEEEEDGGAKSEDQESTEVQESEDDSDEGEVKDNSELEDKVEHQESTNYDNNSYNSNVDIDVNAVTSNGTSQLMVPVKDENIEVPMKTNLVTAFQHLCDLRKGKKISDEETSKQLKALLNAGASHCEGRDGTTLLHVACQINSLELATRILKSGIDVNASKNNGKHALMFACKKGNAELIRLLILYGAAPYLVDNGGQSPVTIVKKKFKGGKLQELCIAMQL